MVHSASHNYKYKLNASSTTMTHSCWYLLKTPYYSATYHQSFVNSSWGTNKAKQSTTKTMFSIKTQINQIWLIPLHKVDDIYVA